MQALRRSLAATHGQNRLTGKANRALGQAVRSTIEALESRCLLSAVAGTVYVDADNDGVFDEGEAGIAGVTVVLRASTETPVPDRTAVTDADGNYRFDDVAAGTYTLSEQQPAKYLDAAKSSNSRTVHLDENVLSDNHNFGELVPASLSGYVYVDADDDGLRDVGEQPIFGATITLEGWDDRGYVWKMAVTRADGYYGFLKLRPGTYTIKEDQPAEYLDGQDTVGTQGGVAGNDLLSEIHLEMGVNGTENNFGERLETPPPPDEPPPVEEPPPVVITTASLSGRIVEDVTGDGLSSDDVPLGGVKVKLFLDRNENGVLDWADGPMVAMTYSDPSTGAYSFAQLEPGRYFVKQSKLCGYVRTAPMEQRYHTVEVSAGDDVTDLDFANDKKAKRWFGHWGQAGKWMGLMRGLGSRIHGVWGRR